MSAAWTSCLCPWLRASFDRLEVAWREEHFGHAWLVAGTQGIGKSNLAHVFATRLVAAIDSEPETLSAQAAIRTRLAAEEEATAHPDLHRLAPAPDKRSISVDQVRDAIADLGLTSLSGAAKAVIIEPAETMTLPAANALLKTLEEPTRDTYFFLVSHQPGLLPATVRSRCQLLAVPTPPAEQALAWLESMQELQSPPAATGLLSLTNGAPLRVLELILDEKLLINKELEDIFEKISRNELNAHATVDDWLKRDPQALLDWIATRLEWAIKSRLAPDAWTPVTDLGSDSLHNAWRGLTLTALFEQWRDARMLLAQLGGGTNVDLALRVLVQGFAPGVANGE